MAHQQRQQESNPPKERPKRPADPNSTRIEGGVGAGDSNSGGGNATGIPDAETAMRTGDVTNRGNSDKDRERLFDDEEARPPREDND
jgi:hypothetical protein